MHCSLQVLTRYLQEVEDLEARLQLATEAEMFDIGIDVSLVWTILLTVEDDCLSSCSLCPPHDFKVSFCWIAVYCCYLACVGTAATEGS